MTKKSRVIYTFLLALAFVPLVCTAQNFCLDTLHKLKLQSKYDSTINYADRFLQEIERTKGADATEYYEVLLEKAVAYEHFDKHNKALSLLFELRNKRNVIPAALRAMLAIETSLTYEKLGHHDSCLKELERARYIIAKNNLDSIRAFYHLRKSSAMRGAEGSDTARLEIDTALYYGNKYKNPYWLGHIYFVEAATRKNGPGKPDSIKSSLYKSIYYTSLVGDNNMYLAACASMIRTFSKSGQSDSALLYARHCLDEIKHSSNLHMFGSIFYRDISEMYEDIGMLDSALLYQKMATEHGIAEIQHKNMVEISELKSVTENINSKLRLEQQEKELKNTRQQIQLGITATVILVLLIISMFYYNRRTKSLLKKNLKQQEEIKAINEDLKESLQKQNILQKELHHRVKNNLQIIIGLLELQEDKSEVVKSIGQQIHSIAAGHELLYQDDIKGELSLNEYLNELLSHFPEESQLGATINIDCKEDIETGLETLIPIGLIINELITNSIKYAIQPGKHLNIDIDAKLNAAKDKIMINYRDNGPGFSNVEEGFGSFVINTMVMQLEGKMKLNSENGVHYSFVLKL